MPLPPIARQSDYSTSWAAASAITESGQRQTLMAICLQCVVSNPGLTAGEIGDVTNLGHQKVWRRLSDLKNLGDVRVGKPRDWRGRLQVTWWFNEWTPYNRLLAKARRRMRRSKDLDERLAWARCIVSLLTKRLGYLSSDADLVQK